MTGDIFRYEVRREVIHDPMYGKTKLVRDFKDDKDGAIAYARTDGYRRYGNDVFVVEKQYTSVQNLARDFALYTRMVWNPWIDPEFRDRCYDN